MARDSMKAKARIMVPVTLPLTSGVAGDAFAGTLQTETHADTAAESGDADAQGGGEAGIAEGSGVQGSGGRHAGHTRSITVFRAIIRNLRMRNSFSFIVGPETGHSPKGCPPSTREVPGRGRARQTRRSANAPVLRERP